MLSDTIRPHCQFEYYSAYPSRDCAGRASLRTWSFLKIKPHNGAFCLERVMPNVGMAIACLADRGDGTSEYHMHTFPPNVGDGVCPPTHEHGKTQLRVFGWYMKIYIQISVEVIANAMQSAGIE